MSRPAPCYEQGGKTSLDTVRRQSCRCSQCEHLHGSDDATLPSLCHDRVAITVKPARDCNASSEWFPVKHDTSIRAALGFVWFTTLFHRTVLSTLFGGDIP